MRMGLALTACLAALAFASDCKANLIVNGSFESGIGVPGPVPGYAILPGTSTNMTGWTVTGDSIDWLNSSYWQSSDGTQSLDLSGNAPGGVRQTVSTIAGEVYTLSFDVSVNPDLRHSANARRLDIKVVDDVSTSLLIDNNVLVARDTRTFADMQWFNVTYTFTATGSSTTFNFISSGLNIDAGGPALDNVVLTGTTPPVNPVPAPPAAVLAGFGLVGGLLLRRKKMAA